MGEFHSEFCSCFYEETAIGSRIKVKERVKVNLNAFCFIGENAPVSSDREKLAWIISSNIPSGDWIGECWTLDQICRWMEIKDEFIRIAMCLLSGRGAPDDPLLRSLEEEQITRQKYDRTWMFASLYENLWEMVSRRWRAFKLWFEMAESQDPAWTFPFKSALELVSEAIQENAELNFLLCFKNRHKETVRISRSFATLSRRKREGRLKPGDEEKFKELMKQFIPNGRQVTWEGRIAYAAEDLARHDRFIKWKTEERRLILNSIDKADQESLVKPEKGGYLPIEEWRNGIRTTASQSLKDWQK